MCVCVSLSLSISLSVSVSLFLCLSLSLSEKTRLTEEKGTKNRGQKEYPEGPNWVPLIKHLCPPPTLCQRAKPLCHTKHYVTQATGARRRGILALMPPRVTVHQHRHVDDLFLVLAFSSPPPQKNWVEKKIGVEETSHCIDITNR